MKTTTKVLLIFLEWKGKGERKRERNPYERDTLIIDQLPQVYNPTRD